jgi:hypothetical protein
VDRLSVDPLGRGNAALRLLEAMRSPEELWRVMVVAIVAPHRASLLAAVVRSFADN